MQVQLHSSNLQKLFNICKICSQMKNQETSCLQFDCLSPWIQWILSPTPLNHFLQVSQSLNYLWLPVGSGAESRLVEIVGYTDGRALVCDGWSVIFYVRRGKLSSTDSRNEDTLWWFLFQSGIIFKCKILSSNYLHFVNIPKNSHAIIPIFKSILTSFKMFHYLHAHNFLYL